MSLDKKFLAVEQSGNVCLSYYLAINESTVLDQEKLDHGNCRYEVQKRYLGFKLVQFLLGDSVSLSDDWHNVDFAV